MSFSECFNPKLSFVLNRSAVPDGTIVVVALPLAIDAVRILPVRAEAGIPALVQILGHTLDLEGTLSLFPDLWEGRSMLHTKKLSNSASKAVVKEESTLET